MNLTMRPEAIAVMMAVRNSRWAFPSQASGRCYVASVRLMLAMRERGYANARLINMGFCGGHHIAVLLDDTVYDMTLRQFQDQADAEIPFPTVLPRSEWVAYMTGFIPEGQGYTVQEED